MERWKRLKEAPRLEISSQGRVRWAAIKIGGSEFFEVTRRPMEAGNGSLYIPHKEADGTRINLYVNRLVARYFLRKPKGGRDQYRVGWRDGNKKNNAAENLFYYK